MTSPPPQPDTIPADWRWCPTCNEYTCTPRDDNTCRWCDQPTTVRP